MITVHVRKQGGAAILTIPSDLMRMLNIKVGSEVELEVTKKGLIARPVHCSVRKRYSLKELLHGTTKENMKKLNKQIQWAREGKSIGRELP